MPCTEFLSGAAVKMLMHDSPEVFAAAWAARSKGILCPAPCMQHASSDPQNLPSRKPNSTLT